MLAWALEQDRWGSVEDVPALPPHRSCGGHHTRHGGANASQTKNANSWISDEPPPILSRRLMHALSRIPLEPNLTE